MREISITRARDVLGETINHVRFTGERVALTRHGKAVAILIPCEDLKLLEKLEDRLDAEAAKRALAESDERIPFEKVLERLGLDRR